MNDVNFSLLGHDSINLLAKKFLAKMNIDTPIPEDVVGDPTFTMAMFEKIKPDFAWGDDNDCSAKISTIGGDVFRQRGESMPIAFWRAFVDMSTNMNDQPAKDQNSDADALDKIIKFCDEIQQRESLSSIWSVLSENDIYFEPDEKLFSRPAASFSKDGKTSPSSVSYDGGWGKSGVVKLPKNPTWLDLWKAADTLIRMSGDSHHVFVEDFSPLKKNPKVFSLGTGS